MRKVRNTKVSYVPKCGLYALRVDGRLIAERLTKREAAYLKRRILRELGNGKV